MSSGPETHIVRLYVGKVMHARLRPVAHRFIYRIFAILIDLDRLAEADRLSWAFSINRFNLVSFQERDHGPCNGESLRTHAEGLLIKAGLDLPPGRLLLLCCPRVCGYVFNPLSIYWRFDGSGALRAIIYEVRNTFGEIHAYVAPVAEEPQQGGLVRQEIDKAFYVSPFLDMRLRYQFRLAAPTDSLRVRILEVDGETQVMAATWTAQARTFDTRALLATCLRVPFLTFKIIAAIHWEALRLWAKGLKLQPRAPAEAPPLAPHSIIEKPGPRT